MIWNLIEEADRYGLSYSEETITENILLYLKRHHRRHVFLKSFSKREERYNGADWEWWIGREGSWNGMRVQAKRIKLPKEDFESLFYQSKKAPKLQIDYLIDQAKANNLTPIYALYTHSKKLVHLGIKNAHCYKTRNGPFNQNGCLIAHAQNVRKQGSLRLSDIDRFSFPWHFLVCDCPVYLGQSRAPNPRGISSLLKFPFDGPSLDEDDGEFFVAEPQEFLPDHIRRIEKSDGEPTDWVEEYCKKWDLAGLAFIDLGKTDE